MKMEKIFNFIQNKKGQSLIELLITMGMAAILMPAFLIGFSTTRSGRAQQDERIQAIAYLREAAESVRIIRDNTWLSLITNGTYCPQPVAGGTTWELKSFPQNSSCDTPASGFTRKIIIADVYRNNTTHSIDPNGSSSSTSLDPSTKAVTVTVSWSTPINSSVSQVMYVTRHDNISYLDTKTADFNAGTNNGTVVTSIYDGEVMLGGGGASDWCKPQNALVVKYNLPGQAYATAISAIAGHAFVTTGGNRSGDSMDGINISDPPQPTPPVVTSGGVYNNFKTYGVFADSGNTYLTSDHPGLTVDIVQTTISPYSQSGTFSDSGGEAGISVYAANTTSGGYTGFVTAGTNLYAFNLNSQSGSRSQDGNPIALAGTGNKVVVIGNYAYIATSSTTSQLQIVNVSNPSSMSIIKSFGVGSSQGATDVFVDNSGQYAYLVTSYVDTTHPDVFMIDVSDPTNPRIVGTANTYQNSVGMSPTGVIAVSGNHLVVVGSGGQQYQVFYTYPSLQYCGGMSPTGITKINAVAGVSESDNDNFAYILTDDSSNEFQIIPGGAGVGTSGQGTFISQPIGPSPLGQSSATFNNFFPIADTPPQTSIVYQVAVAPAVGGSCTNASYTFIGPNGTTGSSDTFATGSAIPLAPASGVTGYQQPAQCFKYKAILKSTNSSMSPILYQVTVNYSP